jgi:thymidylate synthase
MKPKTLIHSGSHCHIYHNAISQTEEYLSRIPEDNFIPSPKLTIKKKNSIYDYTIEDFELLNYNPLPTIKMEIAV